MENADWKKRGAVVLVSIAILAAAFSAGRFSAPLRTETKEVERVVWKDRIVEKEVRVEVAAKAEQRTVYVDRVIREGMVTEKVVEHWNTVESSTVSTTKDKEETSEGERVVTVTKVTTLRPDWRAALLVGAAFERGRVPFTESPMLFGAEVDRRILGGVSVGLWGNVSVIVGTPTPSVTGGALGVAASLEF